MTEAEQKIPLDQEQVKKAAVAILEIVKRQHERKNNRQQLFEDESVIHLIVTLKRIPEKRKSKPIFLPLPNPLYGDQTEVCLITPDPHKPVKEKLKENPVASVKKVIGLTKLRKNYKTFDDRRKLLQSYDLFLADEKVVTFLPSLLGKVFYEKKRHPVPIRIRGNVAGPVKQALGSTFVFINSGVCVDVRVALSDMTPEQITENVMKAVANLVPKIPQRWSNIQSMQIKVHNSPALPIYASLPVPPSVTLKIAKSYRKHEAFRKALIQAQIKTKQEKKAAKKGTKNPAPASAETPTTPAKKQKTDAEAPAPAKTEKTEKTPASGQVEKHEKTPAKSQDKKVAEKTPAKAEVKEAEKTPAKAQDKKAEKTPARTPAKAQENTPAKTAEKKTPAKAHEKKVEMTPMKKTPTKAHEKKAEKTPTKGEKTPREKSAATEEPKPKRVKAETPAKAVASPATASTPKKAAAKTPATASKKLVADSTPAKAGSKRMNTSE